MFSAALLVVSQERSIGTTEGITEYYRLEIVYKKEYRARPGIAGLKRGGVF